jgi:predicted amidophosphoribosyltransferase
VVNNLNAINGYNHIKRLKDTKTTHNWRLQNNTGYMLYKGITKDTCKINKSLIFVKDVVLVDDIYTKGFLVTEDCIQTLFDFGLKVLHYM